jgi:threonine/homoserine/homoserine lactone efflux protein
MLEALGIEHLGLFVLAGWLLNLTPGPDVLCIVSNALRGGMRAGVAAALGVTAGCFVHIVAAAVGVSALLAASSAAFSVLKWVGAAYLLYAGVRLLFSSGPSAGAGLASQLDGTAPVGKGVAEIFRQGFLTNALNPKVALFFLAFVPQFIAPGAPNHALAFLLLGCIFNINAIPVNMGFAALASLAARRLDAVQRGMQWLDRMAGVMFIAFGLKLALTDHPAA